MRILVNYKKVDFEMMITDVENELFVYLFMFIF